MSGAYYNENDPALCEWLGNLMSDGLISPGEIDNRSIEDVCPSDLREFTQCHFFAGIGGWPHALRRAGVPDDRRVWTGSCPCQPFSAAGKGAGFLDERHLWPAWFHLVEQCRPPVVFGEQVASKPAREWLDLVFDDMEGAGYACGAANLPACGVGSPHIRQRLYWVADAERGAAERRGHDMGSTTCGVEGQTQQRQRFWDESWSGSAADGLEYPDDEGLEGRLIGRDGADQRIAGPSGVGNFWRDVEWIVCRDGKQRPIKSGVLPLAHGIPARMVRLRAYGNAICAPLAEAFIRSYLEATCEDGL